MKYRMVYDGKDLGILELGDGAELQAGQFCMENAPEELYKLLIHNEKITEAELEAKNEALERDKQAYRAIAENNTANEAALADIKATASAEHAEAMKDRAKKAAVTEAEHAEQNKKLAGVPPLVDRASCEDISSYEKTLSSTEFLGFKKDWLPVLRESLKGHRQIDAAKNLKIPLDKIKNIWKAINKKRKQGGFTSLTWGAEYKTLQDKNTLEPGGAFLD